MAKPVTLIVVFTLGRSRNKLVYYPIFAGIKLYIFWHEGLETREVRKKRIAVADSGTTVTLP